MPYVLFLDDDDTPCPGMLENLADALDQSDSLGVYCQSRRVNVDNESVGTAAWMPPNYRLEISHMVGPFRPIRTISSVLLRWSAYEECGGWEETSPVVDDMEFISAILCYGHLRALPYEGLIQRLHPNNHSLTHTREMVDLTLARVYSYLGHAHVPTA